MGKIRFTIQSLGLLFAGLTTVFADSDQVTSQNSVKDQNRPEGVDVIGEGSDFVIQGDFSAPETLPAVTKSLENHLIPPPLVPPPKVFTPPPPPPPTGGGTNTF